MDEGALEIGKSLDVTSMRRRIIEAAVQLYRRIGHRKTTVADIARQVSMSSANVYRFFGSKRAVEVAVVAELLGEVVVAAAHAADRDGSAAERLHGALRAIERLHVSRCADDNKLYELVLTSMAENWSIARTYADDISSTIARIIAEGQARGELPTGDPTSLAGCVLSATCAHIHPFAAPACSHFARSTLGQMIDFCIGALREAPQ
ncbi:TetR family transcriptional regulator [Bradyrhizobium sp. BRP22]|uniref:TetR/AcrR family transcriptional regulator n=1 Tax=Bradyrhizobium sp. BRP22 TaxID=2793821 RepID=UPI001CD57ECE|nr:TetR family transcriptional regulator [Bradyrhizobium sp. BRP22]